MRCGKIKHKYEYNLGVDLDYIDQLSAIIYVRSY